MSKLLTISEAAKFLGVAPVTLRLWERQGKISSIRTAGGQRRYSLDYLQDFKYPTTSEVASASEVSSITPTFSPEPLAYNPSYTFTLSPAQRVILAGVAVILVILISAGALKLAGRGQLTTLAENIKAKIGLSSPLADSLQKAEAAKVLGSQTSVNDLLLNINVGAKFGKDVQIVGKLTAPNVLYGITAGTGITISGDAQNPTISANGSNAFGQIKVGTTTFTSTKSADLITLAAGSNVSLSTDTTTNTVTINSSTPDSGWNLSGSSVVLSSTGNIVSIGSSTGSAKLAIDSNTGIDLFTASNSGNLIAKLTDTGLFNLAATGFTAGLKLQNASTLYSGVGAPSDVNGNNGDYYFRADAPSGNQATYTKVSGSWTTAGGASTTLNDAYSAGNQIDTTNARDVVVNIPNGSAGVFKVKNNGTTVTTLNTTGISTTGTIQVQGATTFYSGTGVPSSGLGSNGDYYFRTDGTGNTSTYVKVTGTWTPSGGGSTTLQDAYNNGNTITQLGTGLVYSNANTVTSIANGTAGQVLTISSGAPTWVGGTGTGVTGFWQRALGVLAPSNITDDLVLGDVASASAKFQAFGTTGGLITTGARTGQALAIFNQTSGGDQDLLVASQAGVNKFRVDNAGTAHVIGLQMPTGAVSGYALTTDANGVASWTNITGSGSFGAWTLTGSSIFPNLTTYDVLIGSTSTSDDIGKLTISGTKTGKALAIFNDTGSDQNILVASASGVAKYILDRSGNSSQSGNIVLNSAASIQTTNSQTLTLGGTTTGNIIFSPTNNSGRVGINTATPNNALDVNGTIQTTGFKLTTNPGVGYFLISDGVGNGSWTNTSGAGTFGNWTLTGTTLYPSLNTYDVLIGSTDTTTDIGRFNVQGDKGGKALAVLNSTSTDQNILVASASGVNRLVLTNTGSLSLGTLSPLATLDVRGNSATTPIASISGSTNYASLVANNDGSGDLFTASQSGWTQFVVKNSGNVGIGTAVPATKLNVVGAGGQTSIRVDSGSIQTALLSDANQTAGYVGTISDTPFWLGTNNTARASLSTAGNLFLGSTGDAARALEINGGNFQMRLGNGAAGPTFTYDIGRNTSDGFLHFYGNQGGGSVIGYVFDGADGERMRIDGTGKVGIGTATPIATLDVRGNSGTLAAASVSGQTAFSALVANNNGVGDLFTASQSGWTKFVVNNTGNVQFTGNTSFLNTLTSAATAARTYTLPDVTGTICVSGATCASSGIVGYWQRAAGVLAPANITDDLVLGATATASATFQVIGTTGSASMAGTLTLGNGQTIRPAYGPLALAYKSAANAWATGLTIADTTGNVGIGATPTTAKTLIQGGRLEVTDDGTTNRGTISYVSNDVIMGALSNSGLELWANNSQQAVITSGGLFALASTGTPFAKFSNVTARNSGASFSLSGSAGADAFYWRSTSNTNGYAAAITSDPSSGQSYGLRLATVGNTSSDYPFAIFGGSGNGTGIMYVTGNGNVQIGNDGTPLAALDVRGTNATTAVASASGSTNYAALVANNNGSGDLFTASQSGWTRFTISGAGNVGIRTPATTSFALDVAGNGLMRLTGASAGFTLNDTASNVPWQFSNASDQLLWQRNGVDAFVLNNVFDWITKGNIYNNQDATMYIGATSANASTIITAGGATSNYLDVTSTGSIGINNNSPLATLDIRGNSATTAVASASGSTNFAALVANNNGSGDLFTASQSGWTRFAIAGDGSITQKANTTTGTAFSLNANLLSTGYGLLGKSTSTALTTGNLGYFSWEPTAAATASGNLFAINLGNGADTTGNIFAVTQNGSSLFSVSETGVTSTLPTTFNAAGDVSMAYDLNFTNPTASYIKSNAPLYIQSGPTYANNDLTLQTYGTGAVSIPQSIATTGSPTALKVTGGAHTSLTASTEATDINFNLARTVQFSTGSLATQRAFLIQAPTYAFVGSSTLTNAITVDITGAPITGTNATITNAAALVVESGKTGLGTTSPLATLHVSDSQTATATAMITNTNTAAGIKGLAIKLSSTTLDTTSRFINFLDKSGIVIGKINAANTTTVAYSANGTDFGEYFVKGVATPEVGEIVSESGSDVVVSSTPYDPHMLGIVSNTASFVGGIEGDNKVLVGLTGQVPVKIAASSPAIHKGDFVTSSIIAGQATKALKPGFVIGKALEDWNPGGSDKIMVYINNTWADPNNSLAFDESGNMTVNNISLTDTTHSVADLGASVQTLDSQVASLSAQLNALKVQIDPAASLSAQLWEVATASGKLTTALAVQVPELNVTGKLTVGLLSFDDLTSSISSLTGTINIDGNLAISGDIKVLGASAGIDIIPAGLTHLEITNTRASSTSAIFVTPQNLPVAAAAASTESGKFVISIPAVQSTDLKVNWWIVN